MLSRLLPAHLDNNFRGYKAAIWIFALITAMKLALGFVHIFSADGGAQTLSHVPLDSYPAGAAQNVVGLFARLGLEQLLLGAIFIVVLLRYRALIPLLFLLALVAQAGAFALAACKPLSLTVSSGAAPMHLVLSALYITGLGLSLLGGQIRGLDTRRRRALTRAAAYIDMIATPPAHATLRQALRADVREIQRVRHAVQENRLVSTVITDDEVIAAIEQTGRGWVVEDDGRIVAFAIGNAGNGNIWALFVEPGCEGRGHGRWLHDVMVNWLWSRGLKRLWLTTEQKTRAQRFYELAGWQNGGVQPNGEILFEKQAP